MFVLEPTKLRSFFVIPAVYFLFTSLLRWLPKLFCYPLLAVPCTSVLPPVLGLARSIINLGMGIVLFSRLTAVGALPALFLFSPETCFCY